MATTRMDSRQVVVYSKTDATLTPYKNRVLVLLNDPIFVPHDYDCYISVIDTQIPITANIGTHLFFRLNTNLKKTVNGQALAKIPNSAVSGYVCSYFNWTSLRAHISDKMISSFELYLVDENNLDIDCSGTNGYWSSTIQFDFVKV